VNKNPVLIILNGLAAAAGLVLVATNLLGVTHLDAPQTAAVVAALAGVCNLVALAIRAAVVPVETNAEQVAEALATPTPAQLYGTPVWPIENGLIRVSNTAGIQWRNAADSDGTVGVDDAENIERPDDGGAVPAHG